MFEAKLEEVYLLRDSMSAISELIDETELHIKSDGIEMVASDRAVVAIVDFLISKNAFEEYHYQKDIKIGINLMNFIQILRRANPNDVLRLKLEDNKFRIILEGDSTRSFVLALIDITKEEMPDLSKLESGFSSSLQIDSEILNSGIEDAELITDSVIFTVRKDCIMLKAESDSSSAQLEVPTNSDVLKVIAIDAPVRARYSLDYLKKILKARKLASQARIALATDYPMKIQFEVPDKMKLAFVLAPRVEE